MAFILVIELNLYCQRIYHEMVVGGGGGGGGGGG